MLVWRGSGAARPPTAEGGACDGAARRALIAAAAADDETTTPGAQFVEFAPAAIPPPTSAHWTNHSCS
jgi:hypothetical protein